MGASTSKVLSDIVSVIGNAVAAPFKSVFGRSCENVCEGLWDVVCFIEHICVLDLIRFLLACCLCYFCLVFLYLVYKLGICQCLTKSLCKMCWAACETYWFTLEYMCCYCWHKIRYTRRVYRGHRRARRRYNRDIEVGYISPTFSEDEDFSTVSRKRKSYREDTRRRARRRKRRKIRHYGNNMRSRQRRVSVRLSGRLSRRRRKVKSKHFQIQSLRNMSRSKRNGSIDNRKPRRSCSDDHEES